MYWLCEAVILTEDLFFDCLCKPVNLVFEHILMSAVICKTHLP